MSTLDKLQIQGIRSFGPEGPQSIKFFKPLTLIVGANGSGKTTIIECLKYATTGEMPPMSKGGAFIHDLKLLGKTSVKGQVKLQFWDINGARMVASRSQELTQKKVKPTVKTLDATLFTARHGEVRRRINPLPYRLPNHPDEWDFDCCEVQRYANCLQKTTLTSRLVELDLIVPQYLGVSKAILENVIFCHQDDSLWPLSEPGVLKKKFDAIFEAEKYTKAIDNIKQLRKHQNEELAKFKIIETNAKQDKDKAVKLQRRCKDVHAEIEELRVKTEELDKQIKNATTQAETARENAGTFEETIGRIITLRNQQQYLQQNLDQLGEGLERRTESDDWLNEQLETQAERLASYSQGKEECTNRYNQVKQQVDHLRGQQDNKRIEAGSLKERKRAHEQKLTEREEIIKSTAREHNIRGYDTDLDDMQIQEFMDRVAKLSKDQSSKVEKLRRENAAEEKKIQDTINDLAMKRTQAQQAKDYARAQMAENDRKIKVLEAELNKIVSDEGGKAVIEENIADLQNKLAKAREQSTAAEWPSRLEAVSTRLVQSEAKADTLNHELIESTNQSTSLARLDHLKKDSKDKLTNLKTLLTTYSEQLQRLIGHEVDPTSIEDDVSQVVDSRTRAFLQAQKERDGHRRELEKIDFQRNELKKSIKEKSASKTKHASIVTNAIGGDGPAEYLTAFKELQDDRDTRNDDINGFGVVVKWYKDCVTTAQKHSKCRVCERGFATQPELDRFIQKMISRTSEEELPQMKDELAELEEHLTAARNVRGNYDAWIILKEELPTLQKQLEVFDAKRKTAVDTVEKDDAVVSEREEEKKEAESNTKVSATIARAHFELAKVQRQVDELVSNQSPENKLRALTDIKDDLDAVNREARELRSEQAKIQGEEKRSRDQMAAYELDLSNAKSRLITADADLERKTTKLGQIEDLKQSTQQQRTAVEKHDEELQRVEPHLREEQSRLNEARRQAQTKETGLQREANDIMNNLNVLTNIDREIRSYVEQGGPSKLTQCEREIEGLESNIKELESEQRQITAEINRINNELANADSLRRTYQDNVKYRTQQRELQRNIADLQELEEQDAEADQAKYRREFERWERYRQAYTIDNTTKKGTMTAKDQELTRMLDEYEADYADAAQKYKKAHIEVETTKAAVDDLGRYGGALDKAIMKFHSIKMEEINQITDELWKRTYQGTDVDGILIRSDNETAKGNRSYNYRVCMVKQGAEMDMRGRCSAGQRVLASIIIRLALAECFGVNCGMIALDEPTTNLDQDNIRSLAESLHDIIEVRQAQKNFQLIVITHDEDFLRHMRCNDFAEAYYKVSRDKDQRSQIEEQKVAAVMGD